MYFHSVYVNPGYSSEIASVLEITTFKKPVNGKEAELAQDLTPQNFDNSEKNSSDVNTVMMNVSFIDEDLPNGEAHLEMNKNSSSSGIDEKPESKSTKEDVSLPMPKDTDANDINNESSSSIAVAEVDIEMALPSAVGSQQDPTSTTVKKKSLRVRQ